MYKARNRIYMASLILLLIAFLYFQTVTVDAASVVDELEIEWLDNEEREKVLAEYKIQYDTTEPTRFGFTDFTVSSTGDYAILAERDKNKYIMIYRPDGTFVCTYFYQSYTKQSIELTEESINIFFHRSYLVFSFDKDGNCLRIGKWDNAANDQHIASHLGKRTIRVGREEYYSSVDFENIYQIGKQKYLFVQADGEKSLKYEATEHIVKSVGFLNVIYTFVIGTAIFIGTIVYGIFKHRKNENK